MPAGWKRLRVLGRGTTGTVYKVVRVRDGLEAAHKVSKLNMEHEVAMQRAMAPFAPVVYHAGKKDVIMELVGETMDEYLSVKRTDKELREIAEAISAIGRFLVEHRMTHGDVPMFNFARTLDGRWIMIDFDRSSTEFYRPEVDLLRLQIELAPSTRSVPKSDVRIYQPNMNWLRENALPEWQAVWGVHNHFKVREADKAWRTAYDAYCEEAGFVRE